MWSVADTTGEREQEEELGPHREEQPENPDDVNQRGSNLCYTAALLIADPAEEDAKPPARTAGGFWRQTLMTRHVCTQLAILTHPGVPLRRKPLLWHDASGEKLLKSEEGAILLVDGRRMGISGMGNPADSPASNKRRHGWALVTLNSREAGAEKTTEGIPHMGNGDLEVWGRSLVDGGGVSGSSAAYSGGAGRASHVVRLTWGEQSRPTPLRIGRGPTNVAIKSNRTGVRAMVLAGSPGAEEEWLTPVLRRLSQAKCGEAQPIPRIDDTLDALAGGQWLSTLDLTSGYWQVEVAECDHEKTAFSTPL
ncbi:RNA-directed DNA polymerase -like protein [Trichinella nelsoni]|uniref:RNA-directed DNA polymerase-like protein n=1 Tax=Trichinella nelsoni TaxID=6336 RepID=A0A0V0REP7_9BILA|nr:RNA-directed DNA polymerase -like protein [Trichinella nelsoni]